MLPPSFPGGATNSLHSLESCPILSVSYISSAHLLRPRERLTSPYAQPLEAVRCTHLPLYSGEAPPLHSLDRRLPPSPGGDMLPPTSPGGTTSSLCPWERCCPSLPLGETAIPFRPLEGQYISSAHPSIPRRDSHHPPLCPRERCAIPIFLCNREKHRPFILKTGAPPCPRKRTWSHSPPQEA